jgi:hypothetical protein
MTGTMRSLLQRTGRAPAVEVLELLRSSLDVLQGRADGGDQLAQHVGPIEHQDRSGTLSVIGRLHPLADLVQRLDLLPDLGDLLLEVSDPAGQHSRDVPVVAIELDQAALDAVLDLLDARLQLAVGEVLVAFGRGPRRTAPSFTPVGLAAAMTSAEAKGFHTASTLGSLWGME